jgi:hypothetical protein
MSVDGIKELNEVPLRRCALGGPGERICKAMIRQGVMVEDHREVLRKSLAKRVEGLGVGGTRWAFEVSEFNYRQRRCGGTYAMPC